MIMGAVRSGLLLRVFPLFRRSILLRRTEFSVRNFGNRGGWRNLRSRIFESIVLAEARTSLMFEAFRATLFHAFSVAIKVGAVEVVSRVLVAISVGIQLCFDLHPLAFLAPQ